MGNVCCGSTEESRKGGALLSKSDDSGLFADPNAPVSRPPPPQPPSGLMPQHNSNNHSSGDNNLISGGNESTSAVGGGLMTAEEQRQEAERIKALRQEQARLELIVQATGRGMVAVRSTRGSTGYYDQGFAAALAQHLEQTTQFADRAPIQLPACHPADSVYHRLAQSTWDHVLLGEKDGLAGCAGEHPQAYLDRMAEAFLDAVVPKKERLFAGAPPMVDNLL